MRRLLLAALLGSTLAIGGCFMSREIRSFSEETSQEAAWLGGDALFDVSYLNGLQVNTTRSEQSGREAAQRVEGTWRALLAEQRPLAPVALLPPPSAPPPRFAMPIKSPVIGPPAKTVVEEIAGTDIAIIRRPDGGITVTNRLVRHED